MDVLDAPHLRTLRTLRTRCPPGDRAGVTVEEVHLAAGLVIATDARNGLAA
jgi:hypothetical protein